MQYYLEDLLIALVPALAKLPAGLAGGIGLARGRAGRAVEIISCVQCFFIFCKLATYIGYIFVLNSFLSSYLEKTQKK